MRTRHILWTICAALLALSGKAQTAYSLVDCERMAIENNNRLSNGRLEVKASTQTRKEAFTNYFPTVSGTGASFNANQGLLKANIETQGLLASELAGLLPQSIPLSMMKNGTVAGLTAVQPIFAGGRIINGNKLAKTGEDIARLQLEMAEDEVTLTTHAYFWQIVNLKEKLVTITAMEEMLDTLQKEVEMAVKAGITTRNDLLRVELRAQEMASDRLKIENAINVCTTALAQFVGLGMDDFDIEYDTTTGVVEPMTLYRDEALSVMNRTEVRLLDKSVNAARLQKRIAFGEQLPTISIGGGYLYNDLIGKSNNSGVLFATVSIPVSGWWSGSHTHNRHKIRERQAINNRTDHIELLTVGTRQTWNELTESYKQILLAEKSIQSATENLRLVTNSHKAGVVPLSELLESQLLFRQSKNQYNDAYSAYQLSTLKYKQITTE